MGRKYRWFLFVLFFVIAGKLAFASDRKPDAVIRANNQFAFELYAKEKTEKGNLFFSPFSISSALVMTYEGAKGKTADEIEAVFHFPKDPAVRRSEFSEINRRINQKGKKYRFQIANAMWAQKGYSFQKEYFNVIEKDYGGMIRNLDFMNKSEESRGTINRWVEEQTNRKIVDLIPYGILRPTTRFVLTNAIYFKGDWIKQFNKKNTTAAEFGTGLGPEDVVDVRMMSLDDEKATFNYVETEQLQMLELPYDGDEISMLVLLPKEKNLTRLESSINVEKFNEWRNLLQKQRVRIFMPKFKFNTKIMMSDLLKSMGMPIVFSDEADFSGMTGQKDLAISEVIHQAYVDVDEEGTEAAAATAVVGWRVISVGERILTFRADHPFMFVIQDKITDNIIFMGRVVKPSSAEV